MVLAIKEISNDNMKKYTASLIVFALITLYSINVFNTVGADEIVDDTFDPASFINIQISDEKASPSTVEVLESSTISFRASWTWPGLTSPNDYKLQLSSDSDYDFVLDTWEGTAIRGETQYRDISYELPRSCTQSAGTFTYSIKAYRRAAHQWELMDSKTVTVTVEDDSSTPPEPTFEINDFSIYPSSIASGGSFTLSITILGNYMEGCPELERNHLKISLNDITNDVFILYLPFALRPSRNSFAYEFDIPHKDIKYSTDKKGTRTIRADLSMLGEKEIIDTSSQTLTITSFQNKIPNKPSPPVGPKTVTVGNTYEYYVVTTDPDSDNVKYRYSLNYKESDWSSYYPSGSQASFEINFPTSGSYPLEIQAEDSHGEKSSWSESVTIVVKSEYEADAPEIINFYANPETIYSTGFSSIHWEVENADSVTITHDINPSNALKGSYVVRPTKTTTYKITAETEGHSPVSEEIEIVVDPHPPIVSIDADKKSIVVGDPVIISWDVKHADRVEITNGILTNDELKGERIVYPEITTTYVVTAVGTISSSDSATVYVYDTDGKLLKGVGDSPIFWFSIGMLVVFILGNIFYFQKNKKIPPYRKFFGKIWAWIKNVEYEDKDKKDKDLKKFDHIINLGDNVNSDSIKIYRRKKTKGGEK